MLAEQVAQTCQAWLHNLVLVFRNRSLTGAQLVAVARAVGEPHVVRARAYDRIGPLLQIDVIFNPIEDGEPIAAFRFG